MGSRFDDIAFLMILLLVNMTMLHSHLLSRYRTANARAIIRSKSIASSIESSHTFIQYRACVLGSTSSGCPAGLRNPTPRSRTSARTHLSTLARLLERELQAEQDTLRLRKKKTLPSKDNTLATADIVSRSSAHGSTGRLPDPGTTAQRAHMA